MHIFNSMDKIFKNTSKNQTSEGYRLVTLVSEISAESTFSQLMFQFC